MFGSGFRGMLCAAVLFSLSGAGLQAAPLLELLYLQGQPLAGASSLPGFSALDVVRSNGTRDLVVAPQGNFVVGVNTDPTRGTPALSVRFITSVRSIRG